MMMKEQVLQKENPWGRVVRLRLSYLNMQFNYSGFEGNT